MEGDPETMPKRVETKDYSFWWEENIRWGDQDGMGHVNNVQFARYIEASRIPFLNNLVTNEDSPQAHFILARLEVNYLAEMHFPGRVRVGTNVTAVGTTSVSLSHGLLNKNLCTGTGKSIIVHINSKSRRPELISKALRNQLLKSKPQGI
jgi:acyl-CoA thioester hydrolase